MPSFVRGIFAGALHDALLFPFPPSLDVRDAHGRWKTAVPNLGFPSGKDKTMIVPLSGIFPTGDHHVRIRTNLQIYWDQAFVARDVATAARRSASNVTGPGDSHLCVSRCGSSLRC
jgi:hypothetical protein